MTTYTDSSVIMDSTKNGFTDDHFENFIVSGVVIESKKFTECRFKDVIFVRCTFHDVKFVRSMIDSVTFKGCNFTLCTFDTTCIYGTTFLNCVIGGMPWTGRRSGSYEPVEFINGTSFGAYSGFYRCSFLKGALFKDCKLMYYDVTLIVQDCTFHKFCIEEHTIDFLALSIKQNCPSHGGFVGWKYVKGRYNGLAIPLVAKLYIPADAKRVNGCGSERKCRCNRAKILEYYRAEDMKPICPDYVVSGYNKAFVYPGVGEYVVPDSYDDSVFAECSHGLHFFLTLEEALMYLPM